MNGLLETADELRRMSVQELTDVFADSLERRLIEQAEEARARHGGLRPGNLETFLADRDAVRRPTRLVLELGEMSPHQFAQPEPDIRSPDGIMLYLRPELAGRPDLLVLAISYMIPVINYGEIITDHHCMAYGAALLGLDADTYYQRICDMAAHVGAAEKPLEEAPAHESGQRLANPFPEGTGTHGCGCGNAGSCQSGPASRQPWQPLPFANRTSGP